MHISIYIDVYIYIYIHKASQQASLVLAARRLQKLKGSIFISETARRDIYIYIYIIYIYIHVFTC